MKDYIEQRVKESANYVLTTRATIRATAKHFKVSKSTTANDMTIRLLQIDNDVALRVADIIADNKANRNYRGGYATQIKYQKLRGQ